MAEYKHWTAEEMPDLTDKVVVITGGNSGIGYEAALQFAGKNAQVVLACRSMDRAEGAKEQILKAFPKARVTVMMLDLASLASIRSFSEAFHKKFRRLDYLCNNAGVMALPYCTTADGFEMQFGTNHLGHFALTGLLMDTLEATPGARIVTVSSEAHRFASLDFGDLQGKEGYDRVVAYARSKMSNLLFTYELQRRLAAAGKKIVCVACHPGYAGTNLQVAGARMAGSRLLEAVMRVGNKLFAQSAAKGGLTILYAAVSPAVEGGDYIGPDGFQALWGFPTKMDSDAASHDPKAAGKLWEASEELTGVHYALSA